MSEIKGANAARDKFVEVYEDGVNSCLDSNKVSCGTKAKIDHDLKMIRAFQLNNAIDVINRFKLVVDMSTKVVQSADRNEYRQDVLDEFDSVHSEEIKYEKQKL